MTPPPLTLQTFPAMVTTFTSRTSETSKPVVFNSHHKPLCPTTDQRLPAYLSSPLPSDGRKRTPKWIKKAGLVDDSEDQRRAARSQWAKRYDERLPNSTLDDADLAEGEEGGNYVPSRTIDEEEVARRRREGLWTNEEEEYYNEGEFGREVEGRHVRLLGTYDDLTYRTT